MVKVSEKKFKLQPAKVCAVPVVKRVVAQVGVVKRKVCDVYNEDEDADADIVRLLADVCAVAACVKYALYHVIYGEKPVVDNVNDAVKQLDLPVDPLKQQRQ